MRRIRRDVRPEVARIQDMVNDDITHCLPLPLWKLFIRLDKSRTPAYRRARLEISLRKHRLKTSHYRLTIKIANMLIGASANG